MKITIESTTKIVKVNGVPARIWEGKTESGVQVHCFVTRIAVNKHDDVSQFQTELEEHRAPCEEVASYPLRLVI